MFRRLRLLTPLLLLLACPIAQVFGQGVVRQEADTAFLRHIEREIDSLERVQKVRQVVRLHESRLLADEMRLHPKELLPLARGTIQYFSNRSFNERDGRFRAYDCDAADYLPAAAPLAATYLLKGLGLESRSTWRRMVTAHAFALALEVGLTQGLKHGLSERRPDGSDTHSYPSGHTALAYLSASVLDREFGHLSPWISVGGYMAATATSLLRLRHHRHYINDVFMGAGIGIASAQLGYFLSDRIFGAEGIHRPSATRHDLLRFARFMEAPTSVALVTGSNWADRSIGSEAFRVLAPDFAGRVRLHASSTLYSGVEYSHFLNPCWAVEARLLTAVTMVKADVADAAVHSSDVEGQHLAQWEGQASLKFSVPFKMDQRVSFRLTLGDCFTQRTDFRLGSEAASLRTASLAESSASPSSLSSSFVRIPQSHKFLVGGGIGVDLLDTHKYVAGLQVDYTHVFSPLMPNRLSISTVYRILL